MWFNLLKLDLSSISTQVRPIQADVEGGNININAEDKCRKKLINFQNKLYTFTKTDGVYVDKSDLSNMPENIACKFVEKMDKVFNSMDASFSIPVKPNIDERGELSSRFKYDIMYFGGHPPHRANYQSSDVGDVVFVAAVNPINTNPKFYDFNSHYFSRIMIPAEHHLLMREVKKLWEAS